MERIVIMKKGIVAFSELIGWNHSLPNYCKNEVLEIYRIYMLNKLNDLESIERDHY